MPSYAIAIRPIAVVRELPDGFEGPIPSGSKLANAYLATQPALLEILAGHFDGIKGGAGPKVVIENRLVELGGALQAATNVRLPKKEDLAPGYVPVKNSQNVIIGHSVEAFLLDTNGDEFPASIEFPAGMGDVFQCGIYLMSTAVELPAPL